MFANQGIHPVTIFFSNTKNCFLHLPQKLISHLLLNENQALELSWGSASSVFLSWTYNRHSTNDPQRVELCRQLGERLGLEDGEQGFIKTCSQVSSVHQVFVEPLSFDDWEILELQSDALETQLLNQIRVVFQDAVFPVWVDSHTAIYIQIASFLPSVPFGRLEQFTELIVSPKSRPDIPISGSPLKVKKSLQQQGLQSTDVSSAVQPAQQWGAGLKSFVRHLLMGPVKELPSVPELPMVITDSVFRVCGAPPDSLCTISHLTTHVVHVFPLNHGLNAGHAGGQTQITYGLLSKVPFSKESKDKAKQALDNKKSVSKLPADSGGGETKDEAIVVRVVCRVKLPHKSPSKGSVHSGKVWISEQLSAKINVTPHSAVRIKPIKSAVKVATMIQLQPIIPMSEDDNEIRTVFLEWLHTQSHEPLSCLTARSSTILLHGSEAKLQFVLAVLSPESANDPIDQLFLLATTLLKHEHIQISRETLTKPAEKTPDKISNGELPALNSLGGLDEVGKSAHEFISFSLLAGPLALELGSSSQGLQGGALLITGAKGCGKTSFARALCRRVGEDLDAHLEMLDCKKLQGKRAETVKQMLQDVFEQAEWKQPSMVLLDDLDQIAGAPSSGEHEHSPEALLQQHIAYSLKDIVDDVVQRSSLISLIITTKSEDSLHPSLTELQGSHFFQRFSHIKPPNHDQRADILRCLMLRKGFLSEETLQTLDVGVVAKSTEGYTPQDLALLLERAIHANTAQKHSDHQDCLLSVEDFSQALKGFTPPSLWGVELHSPSGVGLAEVGGLKDVRQQLMDTIMLPAKYPILFSKLPIRHRSGVLLFGAPGTGKTLLVRAVAKDSGMNFISIKGPELLSKYIGASEQAVRDVFQKAQAAKPCILFFDEFDSLAPRRGHDSTGVTDRVVNQLLTQLDGVEGLQGVYVLAATSRPDLIDPALLRPGRLDKCLYCPPPDQEARQEILKALSSGLSLAEDVDLEQLGTATELFTGADLKALLYNAQLEAVHSSISSPPQDIASGSESEMSLSSMIFPNHSSGSEDSVGEGDMAVALEQSMVLLENSDLQTYEENRGNVWRIYFGSPYESELGHSPELVLSNPRCLSGPMSESQELTAACARDAGCDLPSLYMSSLQSGCEELSPEQQEQLTRDINIIKKSYRKESLQVRSPSSTHTLHLSQAHIKCALSTTKPSLSKSDWSRYTKVYESFDGSDDGKPLQTSTGPRVTLA
ncbi:peroxisomal ATPase PEX1 [Eucyclogobius newberryi]|uniref:peroxisomal ATPase PEX1 n=1 Tax=Eucyclogobius newberryi TaxID=166745 RepID=UPI003B5BAF91